MGLKALKEKFKIGHIVRKDYRGICIGSGYVPNLIVINPETGVVKALNGFHDVLDGYKELKEASPSEILAVLAIQDEFSKSIPVFTYEDDKIIELQCEEFGYPNITHCGQMMYENTHFLKKEDAVIAAKKNALACMEIMKQRLEEHELEFKKLKEESAEIVEIFISLKEQFPDIEPSKGK